MGRASTLSLHERRQSKVLPTTGYTVKQIADVEYKDERLCWARIFMRCNWEKVRLLRIFKNSLLINYFEFRGIYVRNSGIFST
uniref:Uncharacterized protein n=1 Tax=Heterorhabditis bacteriophora TaxID=37862 RepID=A0A1I7W9B2_HETBA